MVYTLLMFRGKKWIKKERRTPEEEHRMRSQAVKKSWKTRRSKRILAASSVGSIKAGKAKRKTRLLLQHHLAEDAGEAIFMELLDAFCKT